MTIDLLESAWNRATEHIRYEYSSVREVMVSMSEITI